MSDKTKDIVEQLRYTADTALPSTSGLTRLNEQAIQLLGEAADEIEHLRSKLEAVHQALRRAQSSRSVTSGKSEAHSAAKSNAEQRPRGNNVN